MHEFGHTLGLGHGGGDDVNNKSNYVSVMNYDWQTPKDSNRDKWGLFYSDGTAPSTAYNDWANIRYGIAGRSAFSDGFALDSEIHDELTVELEEELNNVAPVIDALTLASTTVDENGVAGLTIDFTDINADETHTIDIDWGDPLSPGNLEQVTISDGSTSITLTHQYLDDNGSMTTSDEHTIVVTITDSFDTFDSGSTSVTVVNSDPILFDVAATSIDENGLTTITGSITDVGTLDNFTLNVDWGDPLSPDNQKQFTFPPGTTSFSLTHQYLDDNPTNTGLDDYRIALRLADDDGGEDTEEIDVTVKNVAPIIGNFASNATLDTRGETGETVTVFGRFHGRWHARLAYRNDRLG